MIYSLRLFLLTFCLVALFEPHQADAQTPARQVQTSPANEASPEKRQAEQISALIAGTLGTDVDASRLFEVSFSGDGSLRLKWILAMVGNNRRFAAARANPSSLTGLSSDQGALAIAQAEFMRLPLERRSALLSAHKDRQDAALAQATNPDRQERRRAQLRERVIGLQAFLEGRPAPPSTIKIDLLDPSDAGLDKDRRKTLMEVPAAPTIVSSAGTSAPREDATNAQLVGMVDSLRSRILGLPVEERERLSAIQTAASANHLNETIALEQAAQQLATANALASSAGTELERLIADQRSSFLTMKRSFAEAKLELARKDRAIEEIVEMALSWRRQIEEVEQTSASEGQADLLYSKLITSLKQLRGDLGTALRQSASTDLKIPVVPPIDSLLAPGDPRTAELGELRAELFVEAEDLRKQASAVNWKRRTALYNAMIEMNGARLTLLGFLSSPMRARVTGFSQEGLAQAQRELNQIILAVRYNLALAANRFSNLGSLKDQPKSWPLAALIKLFLVAVIFQLWRKRGETLLAAVEIGNRKRRPPTLTSSVLASAAGLLRKVRRPLGWLLLLLVIDWMLPALTKLGAINLIWLTLVWVFSGATAIRFADALAQGTGREDPRAALRRRSLQLVVGVAFGVGLILSLSVAMVGRGAIYNWILSFCWLLIIPVIVILVRWWRERIDTLCALGAPNDAILAWSTRHQDGMSGTLGRIAAGAVLLFQGAQALVTKRVNQLALIREISGQRAREKAAARVEADEASGRFTPIAEEEAERLAPHGRPVSAPSTHLADKRHALPSLDKGRIVAIVGERGLGKTTAIDRMFDEGAFSRRIQVEAGTLGFDKILSSLAQQIGCEPTAENVAIALGQDNCVVAIDNVQRIVVPAIGGLDDFDRLIAFARNAGANSSWVIAIGGPAWSYLSRARADRAIFDNVFRLPRWSVSEIRSLIERRTAQAALEPSFNFEIQDAGTLLFDSDMAPEERARRIYFEELTEFSEGNPAVALEFWRRSLFNDQTTGTVAVRTYKTPDVAILAALPNTTMFVLRAILQMELATFENVVRSTDLEGVAISESLRALLHLGVITETAGAYQLSLFWFKDVRRLLERQNLMVRASS